MKTKLSVFVVIIMFCLSSITAFAAEMDPTPTPLENVAPVGGGANEANDPGPYNDNLGNSQYDNVEKSQFLDSAPEPVSELEELRADNRYLRAKIESLESMNTFLTCSFILFGVFAAIIGIKVSHNEKKKARLEQSYDPTMQDK